MFLVDDAPEEDIANLVSIFSEKHKYGEIDTFGWLEKSEDRLASVLLIKSLNDSAKILLGKNTYCAMEMVQGKLFSITDITDLEIKELISSYVKLL